MPKKNSTPASTASTMTPTADTPALTPAASTVLSLLDAHGATTATDLADRTGLGRSTVTKALATLHDAGLAVRQEGGHDGARRVADRWFAAPGATVPPGAADAEEQAADDTHSHTDPTALMDETVDESPIDTISDTAPDNATEEETTPAPPEAGMPDSDAEEDERSADQPDEEEATAAETGTDPDDASDAAGPSEAATGERAPDDEAAQDEPAQPVAGTGLDQTDDTTPEPREVAYGSVAEHVDEATQQTDADGGGASDSESGTDPQSDGSGEDAGGPDTAEGAALTPEALAKPSGPRLGNGELRTQVEAHLRAHPDKSFTSTELHHVLNRSSGAIANACETLVETGKAIVANEKKPRRFQWSPAAAPETA